MINNRTNIQPPRSIDELMQRVSGIAGLTISDLAHLVAVEVPDDLKRDKGFVGQLLELVLGSTAGNKATPDFELLAVELKTVPLDHNNKPMESTYVSVVPLKELHKHSWQQSAVYAKLKHVLWMPIQAAADIPLAQRKVGTGILWNPTNELAAELKQDYEEFMEIIALGDVESITAHQGKWLQIRPKAANNSALTNAVGPEGKMIKTLPRGFYLRPSFSRKILAEYFGN